MPKSHRGEVTGTIGELEITLIPTFNRIARAEMLVKTSCFTIANDMGEGKFLQTLELAAFLEALSKPKVPRDSIGEALVSGNFADGVTLLGKIIEKIMTPDSDSEKSESSGDLTLPGEEEDDSGK